VSVLHDFGTRPDYIKTGQNSIMAPRLNANHAVAFLGLILAICVFTFMARIHAPSKVCWGSAILSILVVAIFWSSVSLGADDDEEDEI
jgi:hypothetical protein